jgi:hypothetical protein
VIVSASYCDDIPAHYGPWFMKRLEAGYCRTYDSEGVRFHRVALTRAAVDCFVFWTRNARPFLAHFEEIERRGFPFIVQYGITREAAQAVEDMHALAGAFGPRRTVWRYEPMQVNPQTTLAWHAANFERLARELAGATDEVVVGFGSRAGSERTSAEALPRENVEATRQMLKGWTAIARAGGMRLSVCSQPDYLVPGTSPARCIDARRLSAVAGREIAVETSPRWAGCLCARARDIGAPPEAGLAPCGAASLPRRENHDEDGEFLVPPPAPALAADGAALPF